MGQTGTCRRRLLQTFDAVFVNQGTISAQTPPAEPLTINAPGTWSNTGTSKATNGGTLIHRRHIHDGLGTFNSTGGTIEIAAFSTTPATFWP